MAKLGKTAINLDESARGKFVALLNQCVGLFTDLYVQTELAHWDVRPGVRTLLPATNCLIPSGGPSFAIGYDGGTGCDLKWGFGNDSLNFGP